MQRNRSTSWTADVPCCGGIAISSSGTARTQLDWLALTPTAPASPLLEAHARLGHSLFGRRRFARLVAARVPSAVWLHPEYTELRPGFSRLKLPVTRELQRADGQIDPIAISALCEIGAVLVAELSVPATLDWQIKGMTIEHLRPAGADIEALTRLDRRDWRDLTSVALPITVSDASGAEVARAVVPLALSVATGASVQGA